MSWHYIEDIFSVNLYKTFFSLKRLVLILFIGLVFNTTPLFGQNVSTEGSDFWFGFMDNWLQDVNNPIILEIYISANDTTNGTLEMPLNSVFEPLEFTVIPGVTTELTLPSELAEAVGSNNIENKGIHISTEKDVSIYAMNKRQYSADVTVILPTFSLSNKYLVMAHWEDGNRNNNDNSDAEFLIVATENNTEIEITPSQNTEDGGPADVPFRINLDKGQTYQVQARGDLTGTKIVGVDNADGRCNNFAVFGGNQYTKVGQCDHPDGHDHLFAQMYPVKTWGTDYVVVNYATRIGGDIVKILASEDSTEVAVAGQNLILNAGEFVSLTLDGVNTIESDKPVAVGQFSRSQGCDGTRGDPFLIMISPNQQLLRSITFNAPTIATVSNYSLNVIAPTFDVANVRFDGQPITNSFSAVPGNPDMSYARVMTNSGNHTIFSEEGFIAYVYGYGWNESFGYSTGAGLANLSLGVEIENQLGIAVPADSICLHDQTIFTPVTSFDFDTYFYDFGDGSSIVKSDTLPVVHQYTKTGTYLFRLTGLDDQDNCSGGNEETEVKVIKVINPQLLVRGPRSICPNTSGVQYFVENNIHYENEWFVEGGNIVNVSNDTIIVDWGETNNQANVKLVSHNRYNCYGDTVVFPVRINIKLDPEAPFGADSLCASAMQNIPYYTYPTQGSQYTWFVENGKIIAGQGTHEVSVNWFSEGMGKLWFTQFAMTDTICDGVSDTLMIYIQREPSPDANIQSDKSTYQVEEPVMLYFAADTLFQFTRLFINDVPYADSLNINDPLELIFNCAGAYNFRVEVHDTVGICDNIAIASHNIEVVEPKIELIRVTHDLQADSTLNISWEIEQADFWTKPFILQRKQLHWGTIDTLFEKNGAYTDSPLNTMELIYLYRVNDQEDCAKTYQSRIHSSMVLEVEQDEGSDEALLRWSPYIGWEYGIAEYIVQRNIDGNGWSSIATTTATEFVYENDTAGFDYCFRINAVEAQGNESESFSNADCALFVPDLYAYNLITPNDDGKNETFIIENVELYTNSRLVITNRWGSIVFDQTGYQNDWRGTEGGKMLTTGVYFYTLKLNEPRAEREQINGTISILR